MKVVYGFVAMCVLVFGYAATAPPSLSAQGGDVTVIQGGTLIDGTGRAPIRDAVIVIEGNRIKAVGARADVQMPQSAKKVDAAGKWILPGLIDSHGHYRGFVPELLINHGITTLVDTGNYMDYILAVREATASGKLWGPRIAAAGSGIEGSNVRTPSRDRLHVRSAADAKAATEEHVRRKVDFIKVYAGITAHELKAVSEAAHRHGLPVVGHLQTVDAREAAVAGIDGLIHASGISAALVPESLRAVVKATPSGGGMFHHEMDESKFHDLARFLVDRQVMIQPDLVHSSKGAIVRHWDRFELESRRLLADPNLAYIPREAIQRWTRTSAGTPEVLEQRRIGYEKMTRFLKSFVDAGGLLLAGSDFQGSAAPGVTLHQELEVFVHDVGLTPMQAIQTATLNPATFYLKGRGLGTVESGNLADLLILTKDPLQDIRHTRTVEQVMKDGRLMTLGYHAWYLNPYQMPAPDPIPASMVLTSVTPYVVTRGEPGAVLTVKGTGFARNSLVRLAGQFLKTTYVASTELRAEVPEVLLQAVGRLAVEVTYTNRRGATEASTPWFILVKHRE